MTRDEIQAEISEKKQLLAQTDYETIKAMEGFFTEATKASTILGLIKAIKDSISEIVDLFESRASWRARINELEETAPDEEAGE